MIASDKMTLKSSYHRTEADIQAEMDQVTAAQKDPAAFAEIYTKYYSAVLSFIYHRIEDRETSFEICAQVFYKALDNLRKYQARGIPFSAWLFRIAANEINDHYRKHRRAQLITIDENGFQELCQDLCTSVTEDRDLFAALEKLDSRELELINMRFFEQRPFAEIADIMKMNESACKMKIYRILEHLSVILKDLRS